MLVVDRLTAPHWRSAKSGKVALQTRAVRDGDDYVITGTKMFVTNAPVADLFVTYATLNPALFDRTLKVAAG